MSAEKKYRTGRIDSPDRPLAPRSQPVTRSAAGSGVQTGAGSGVKTGADSGAKTGADSGAKEACFYFLSCVSVILGLFCLYRVCSIIVNVGGNNISNDYAAFMRVVDEIMSGSYDFRRYASDTFVGQHWLALPVAFHVVSAKLFEWNARAELLMGASINVVRALLVTSLLCWSLGKRYAPLIGGLVLTLVFSISQTSMHLFGQACFPVGLSVFGFCLGLFGLVAFHGRAAGLITMVAGGLIAAASMGNTVPCWLAFLFALLVLGYRRLRDYAIWLVGLGLAAAPYAYFLTTRAMKVGTEHSGFSLEFVLNVTGRQFANNIGYNCGPMPMAEQAGALGFAAFAFGVAGCLLSKRMHLTARASMALCVYGIVTAIMLSLVRDLVAPWYTGFLSCFWVGVLGLLLSIVITPGKSESDPDPRLALILKGTALSLLAAIAVFYALSNRSWADKHTYLFSRSPASEAALRHFRHGPTYLESLLFQWGDGHPEVVTQLAVPLERHGLSAFSSRQTWALQGEFLLPSVKIFEHDGVPDIRWIQGNDVNRRLAWSTYHHANLYLHSPNAIEWTVSLPERALEAAFVTQASVRIPGKKKIKANDGVIFKLSVKPEGAPAPAFTHLAKVSGMRPVSVRLPLAQYKGRKITIRLSSEGGRSKSDDYLVLSYPVISVELDAAKEADRQKAEKGAGAVVPVNTDISPSFPRAFEIVRALPPVTDRPWRKKEFRLHMPVTDPESDPRFVKVLPSLVLELGAPLALDRYDSLKVKMRAPLDKRTRALKGTLAMDDGTESYFSMPLIPDEKSHTYLYDMKLLELNRGAKLKQLTFYPVNGDRHTDDGGITLEDAGFVVSR